jgi:Terminase small subunit
MGRTRRRHWNRAARARVAASRAAQRVVGRERATRRAATAAFPRADAPTNIDRRADSVVAVDRTGWLADPALAVQLEEALATLTLKRRRFLLNYLDSGNATRSALAAGYNCKDPRSASDVGREVLASPSVRHACRALLEARGLSGAKLDEIHALHLSRHTSPDRRPRPLAACPRPGAQVPRPAACPRLEAPPRPAPRRDDPSRAGAVRRAPGVARSLRPASPRMRMDRACIRRHAHERRGPGRTLRRPIGRRGRRGLGRPDGRLTPPPDPNETAPDWPSHLSASEPGPPPPRPPMPSRAPDRPPRFEPAAARPEDRVRPPIDRPATLAADDHPDEPPPPPRDWYKRDCRW